jgi:16S rRNA (guanine527-N7)-methyltransferase
VTSREFRDRVGRRLQKAVVPIPGDLTFVKLEAYFELLARWNAKINLTALPLDKPTDQTFDRLFTEPLAAARHFPSSSKSWYDLGTGGGSPAIPLKIVLGAVRLTMIESKVRKAAFLREVVRTLGFLDAEVENARFEEVVPSRLRSAEAVTVRAVRSDPTLFKVTSDLLVDAGRLLLFRTDGRAPTVRGFDHVETVPLTDAKTSYLAVYSRTPRCSTWNKPC